MSSQPQSTNKAALGHKFGTFIEGFDSILYNPGNRASNQDRFLAEFFYGLIYDSALVLAEPMVFDNHTMIRLLRRMQTDYQYLLKAIHYAPYREPLVSLENTFFNHAYVCSSLSETANEERRARIGMLLKCNPGANVTDKATALIECKQSSNFTEDDRIALENIFRIYHHNDTPWLAGNACTANTKHGYNMHCQLRDWLEADDKDRDRTPQSPLPLWNQVSETLKCPDVQPCKRNSQEKETLSFHQYFSNRSNFHNKKPFWQQALNAADFGRLEEYVNSAYMIALQKTCQAATAVQTPTDFGNQYHVKAQAVMNKSANDSSAFEFKLSLTYLESNGGLDTNQASDHIKSRDKLEAELLEHLNALHQDAGFIEARNKLGTVNRSDPDYREKYIEAFTTLADLVNKLEGPFQLHTQGNMVVELPPKAGQTVVDRVL